MKRENIILIIVCIIIVIIGIVSMPNIYKLVESKAENNDVFIPEEKETPKEKMKITTNSDLLKELVFPIMNNNITKTNSYYNLDHFTTTDISNNDILATAFTQIYSGYLISNPGVGCASESISFNENYLELRIQNIFGPNTKYNLTDFTLYNNINNDYIGSFKYDINNKKYMYYGNCAAKSAISYYDIKSIYDVELSDDENILKVYYYVGFVKLENGNYTLYSDVNYTNQIKKGVYTDMASLEKMLSKLNVKKYQYTFRKDICNYDSYCFYEGKWING